MSDEEKPPKFWHTLPGLLTAIAGIITALTGFIGLIYQAAVSNKNYDTVIPMYAIKKINQLAGNYYLEGKNPDGTVYTGKVTINDKINHYEIIWKIGNQTYYGAGILDEMIFRVQWERGLVTYIIKEDGSLDGSWANGMGTETLTPFGK